LGQYNPSGGIDKIAPALATAITDLVLCLNQHFIKVDKHTIPAIVVWAATKEGKYMAIFINDGNGGSREACQHSKKEWHSCLPPIPYQQLKPMVS